MATRSGSEGTLSHHGGSENYDPGADAARRYPDWVIRHRSLRGLHEVLCPVRKVILLEHGHSRAARRCSLAHAVAHIDLGHQVTPGGVLGVRQEASADLLASRRLITVEQLAGVLTWTMHPSEVAAELDVDLGTLNTRRRNLRSSEWRRLRTLVRRSQDIA